MINDKKVVAFYYFVKIYLKNLPQNKSPYNVLKALVIILINECV
jgi:hypothetical protein